MQVPVQHRQGDGRKHHQHTTQRCNAKKRCMPAHVRGHEQAQWHTRHGGDRKRRHHDAHGPAPALERDYVAHNGLAQRRQHTPKHPRHDACHHQRAIGGCQATGQCGQGKQHIQHQQQLFAAKTVDVGGRQQARSPGRQGVGRHQQAELGVADGKQLGELRPQRHHDHEVEDVGELDACECQQQPQLAAGGTQRGHGRSGFGGMG